MYQRGEQIEPIDESNRRVSSSSFNLRFSVAFSVVILSLTFGGFIYIKFVHPFLVKSTDDYTHMYHV